jgi:hypothetical protein
MANSLFCSGCGKKILFEAVKPKCCGYCGKSLDGGLSSFAVTKVAPRITPSRAPVETYHDDDDEGQEESYDYGRLQRLDVVVNVDEVGGEKLESLAYQKPEERTNFKLNKNVVKKTRKLQLTPDNLPQFMKDSGTGRKVLEEPRISASESAE